MDLAFDRLLANCIVEMLARVAISRGKICHRVGRRLWERAWYWGLLLEVLLVHDLGLFGGGGGSNTDR